jgi:hypothetical protein
MLGPGGTSSYDGDWVNDHRTGKGTAVYTPNDNPNAYCSYTGGFQDDQPNGTGVAMYCLRANGRLDGSFLAGKPINATHYTGDGAILPPNSAWSIYTNGVAQLTAGAQAAIA